MSRCFPLRTDEETHDGQVADLSSEMAYFRSCLGTEHTVEWLRKEKAAGRNVIGVMSAAAPVEIVLAAGAVPVRLVGFVEGWTSSRRDLPRDICPVAASCFTGARILAKAGLLDAVVVPGTCDWKRKLAELLHDTVHVVTLEPAASLSPTFVEADLRRLARELALITDVPVVRRNLMCALENMARASSALGALQRIRLRDGCTFLGADALVVEQSLLRDDLSRWTNHCASLVQCLTESFPVGEESLDGVAPRVLLVGSPLVSKGTNVVHLVEKAGGRIVAEDFDCRLGPFYPVRTAVRPSAGGFGALATRWARSCFCSVVGDEDEEFVFRAVDESGVEGLVFHASRSCAQIQTKIPAFLRRASARDVPILIIETAEDEHETERLLVRIEPFIEMLLQRRTERGACSWS